MVDVNAAPSAPALSRTHLVFNADVRSMALDARPADALAWRDGVIVAVGSQAEVAIAAANTGAEVAAVDVGGATVLPGFIDAHQHPSYVVLYGGRTRLTPPGVTDIASLQRALAAAACTLAPGQWLVAAEWNEALLKERRPPTRAELDDAVPDRPVAALDYSCHRMVANSRALELAGIDKSSPDPSGGLIVRGPGGLPNGLLIERGISRVESLARASVIAADAEGFLARLAELHRQYCAVGVTRIVDAAVPPDLAQLYRSAASRGLLTVPTVMMPVSVTGYFETPWDALDGPLTGTTEGLLTTGPIKLVFDGGQACSLCMSWWQTAGATLRSFALSVRQASFEPLRIMLALQPRLGTSVRTGISMYRREEALKIVQAVLDRGFAVAVHAMGNDAVDIALSTFEAMGGALHRSGRPRIEHGTFVDRGLVERLAGSGAAVVVQPDFLRLPLYGSVVPIPGMPFFPVRWMLDAGVLVAGSSDFPGGAFDPLDAVRSAVARRTVHGDVFEKEQRIDLHEALMLYTRSAAAAVGCLDRCGTLEKGKRADIVLLDQGLSPASLSTVRVKATVLGGDVAYGALG